MKYPKPWDAGMPAGRAYVSSVRDENRPHSGMVYVGTYVNRPNTPDHTRVIRTWLSVAEAEDLRDQLNHHIELMKRFKATNSQPREVGVVERMTNSGEIGTGGYAPHVFEEDKSDAPRVHYGQEDIPHCAVCGQAENRPVHRVA